jgi:phage-related protein
METYKQQLSQLGPAAADFVKYFVSTVMPSLQAFQSAIGGPLFVGLKAGLDNLINVALPVLTPLFKTLAGAAGDAFLSISTAFTTPYNLANLKDIFGTAAYVVKQFGATAGTAMTGITTALSAASPAIKALSDFLNTKVTKFVAMLETKKATGELTTFFNTALKLFEQISGIVGNLFGGLFDVIKANTGPGSGGQMLLDFFTTISKQFKDFAGSKAGQESLRTMFADAAKNVIAMLPVIGGIFKILLDLGTNPSVAVFWTTIKQALPFVQDIFTQFTNAGPTFGQLIVQLAKFFSLLVSSGAIDLMFKVFVITLTLINNIFSNKLVLSVFQFSHSLFAIGAAFAVMGAMGGKVLGFFIGHFESISKNIGDLKKGFGILRTVAVGAIESLAEALGIAFAPAAAIVAIVVAIGVVIYELFKHNKVFHDYVMKAWDEIKIGIGVAWNNIKKWFDELMGYATKLFAWMEPALQIAWTTLKDLFGIIWSFIRIQLQILRGMLEVMWEVITTAFKVVVDVIKGLWALFTGNWSGVAKSIGNIGKDLWAFIHKDLSIAWSVVKSIWNTITGTVAGFIKSFATTGAGMWNWLLDGLKDVANGLVSILNAVIHGINKLISFKVPSWVPGGLGGSTIGVTIPDIHKLADGGIVSPKNGGTLALLAEAGKSERIEPLDANGLSNRDKALIARMTSGAGGGVTINVHPTPGMSSSEVAAMVSRQFAFHMRAGGR